MAGTLVTRERADEALGKHLGPYKQVIVLLVYWRDSDYDFKSEADRLADLFRHKFNYHIRRFEIPPTDGALGLIREIIELIEQFSKPRSLIIIHYGGHGDPDATRPDGEVKERKKSVWAAKSHNTNEETLNWSEIQPLLRNGKGDFLVLLDCCFGAQAARSPDDRVIPENVELLAAASMNVSTPAPPHNTFTAAFIEEVTETLHLKGRVNVRDVHTSLASTKYNLYATPALFTHRSKSTICLEPLLKEPHSTSRLDPEAVMTLKMMISRPLDDDVLVKLVGWLGNFIPHEVYGLQVTDLIHRSTGVQDFILPSPSASRSALNMKSLPPSSKAELKGTWASFIRGLQVNLNSLFDYGAPLEDTEILQLEETTQQQGDLARPKLREFLESLDDNIALLENVIERNVLSLPELIDEPSLTKAIENATSQKLNLVESLRIRLENVRFEQALHDRTRKHAGFTEYSHDIAPSTSPSPVPEHHPELGRLLVEYSYFADLDEINQERNETRMDHLVKVLRGPEGGFNTPDCLHWTRQMTGQAKTYRYALLFKNPRSKRYTPVSLYEAMAASQMPTFGQRFKLAQSIGRTLQKWHTVGWVHESVSSLNVILFKDSETGIVDFTTFYLFGFSFSRLTSKYSNPRQSANDLVRDVYQHPHRQGYNPESRHTKEHDLYSFGVLLFEIGWWGCAPKMFNSLVKAGNIRSIQEKMLKRIEPLGRAMGTEYASATKLCVEMDFGVAKDDAAQSELARVFEYQVLKKLEPGKKLDT